MVRDTPLDLGPDASRPPARYSVQAEPEPVEGDISNFLQPLSPQTQISASSDVTPPTILYAKPVCWEHLHPSASTKTAQERIGKKSSMPVDELLLSLDPASLSVLDPPLVKAEAPSLDAPSDYHDSCVEPDSGIPLAPLSSSLVQGESLHSPLLDQLVDPGTLEPDTLLRSCIPPPVLNPGTSDVSMGAPPKTSKRIFPDGPSCDAASDDASYSFGETFISSPETGACGSGSSEDLGGNSNIGPSARVGSGETPNDRDKSYQKLNKDCLI